MTKLILSGLLLCLIVVTGASNAGELHIHMYSLPGEGVQLRDGTAIRVQAFGVQADTDTRPLGLGPQLNLRPNNPDVAGGDVVSGGVAQFTIPPGENGGNATVSFQFSIRGSVVQTVLGAVVPPDGVTDLHVVVPDPVKKKKCVRCYRVRARWGCFRRGQCR